MLMDKKDFIDFFTKIEHLSKDELYQIVEMYDISKLELNRIYKYMNGITINENNNDHDHELENDCENDEIENDYEQDDCDDINDIDVC